MFFYTKVYLYKYKHNDSLCDGIKGIIGRLLIIINIRECLLIFDFTMQDISMIINVLYDKSFFFITLWYHCTNGFNINEKIALILEFKKK